jgi:Ca2+-binding EF-hand superfamily protein
MRVKLLLLLGFATLFVSSSEGLSQSGGPGDSRNAPGPQGDSRGPGGFGGRGGRGDPNQFFDMLSNGKDVAVRSEILDPRMQMMFDRMAERMGITSGRITRQEFLADREQRAAGGSGRGGAGNASRGAPGTPGDSNAPPGGGGFRGRRGNPDATAEGMFQRLDQNGDGYLNYDEMPDQLRKELDQWDTDRNRLIDLNEFRAYFQARVQPSPASQGSSDPSALSLLPYYSFDPAPVEAERKPPVVYRAGKLPRELPAWFAQLDTDQDGQIGLYEWKASGKSIQEFDEMDSNKDGFLTVDEVLRFVNKGKNPAGQTQLAQQNYGYGGGGSPGYGPPGFGPPGFGPGGGDYGFNRGFGRGGGPGGPRNWGGPNPGGRRGRPRGDGPRGGPYQGDY